MCIRDRHIAAGGKVAVLVDPHVPPVCFIVEVREQVIGNINSLHILHIDAAQGFIVLHTGIKLKAIQVLRKIDQVSHAGSMFAAVNDRLKLFQVALIQLGEQAGDVYKRQSLDRERAGG